jgi:hypothetical protein
VHRERLHTYYLCSRRLRRPKRFLSEAPFGEEELFDFKLYGHRVGFQVRSTGGESEAISVKWLDLNTGRSKETYPDPDVVGGPAQGYAIGPDGGIAVLLDLDDEGQRVVYARAKPKGLGKLRVIARIPWAQGEYALDESLTIADGVVTWTMKSGAKGSAPITPGQSNLTPTPTPTPTPAAY